ncbi:hypothetical protein [Paenibacillus sp. y28]|uniref:hypothetical protein n=1 Tax=Paenibacillus sp. y28 TaxID=3129110 RepID=UPI0030181089
MLEHLLCIIVLFAGLGLTTGRELKDMNKKELLVTFCILLPSLYFAVLFIWQPDWPGLSELLQKLYGGPSKLIVDYLKG